MPLMTPRAGRARTALCTLLLAALIAPALVPSAHGQRRARGLAAAAERGPVVRRDAEVTAMMREIDPARIEASIRKLVSFGTRNTLSRQDDPARGIGAASDWIFSEMQRYAADSGGRLRVERQTFEQEPGKFARIAKRTRLTNIVATLAGTQTESAARVYVVSGHYDSMCGSPVDGECDAPGANDDASGTAAVMELARVMSKRRFDATLVFMTVAGEEQGLVGATYYAEEAKKAGANIDAMFTNDIVGNTLGGNGQRDRRTLRVFSEGVPSDETEEQARTRRSVGGENDSQSRQLARFVKETGDLYLAPGFRVQLVYRRDRYGRGGDHIPFLERGYAAVRFTEPNENYDHQHQNVRTENGTVYGDLPEFVDFAYVAQVARVNCAALAELARAPARPRGVAISTRRLSNDTDLQWEANTEPDFAGYEVVWRDTTSPVWTASRFVGRAATSYTAKGMSKDNYFFGVRSIDRDGHRSAVSYPRPSAR